MEHSASSGSGEEVRQATTEEHVERLKSPRKDDSSSSEMGTTSISTTTSSANPYGDNAQKVHEADDNWVQNTVVLADVGKVISFDEGDSENPMNFSPKIRWGTCLLISFSTFVVTMATSEYTAAYTPITTQFGISSVVFLLGLSMMLFGFAFGPLFWSPLSEMQGRKLILVLSTGCFFVLQLGCALATNIASILVTRFFMGFFGSAPLSVGSSVVGDLFKPENINGIMAVFALAPLMGPILGPLIGGAVVASNTPWPWIFWIIFILGGIIFFCMLFIPETYAPVLLSDRARKMRKETGKNYVSPLDVRKQQQTTAEYWKINLTRPFYMLIFEPIVTVLSIYMALIYGLFYLLFTALPYVYIIGRGWTSILGALPFIALGFGFIFGMISMYPAQLLYLKSVDPKTKRALPEARLFSMMWAAVTLPICFFWFAWTSWPASIPWAASVVSLVLFGFGMVGVFLSSMSYIIDCYPTFAASGIAATAFLRSVTGAIFPLFAGDMYKSLGINWAATILAFLCLALTPIPFIFYKFGAKLRARSKLALQDKDLAIVTETTSAADQQKHEENDTQSKQSADLEFENISAIDI